MNKKIFIIDPLEDDILEHSLYLRSYENFCKKNKIDLCNFYICTESGRTYQLGSLLWSLKQNYVGEKRKLFTPYFKLDEISDGRQAEMFFSNSIFIVNSKLISFLPNVFSNISKIFKDDEKTISGARTPVLGNHILYLLDGYFGLNVREENLCFGLTYRRTTKIAICAKIDKVPSKEYLNQLNCIYKDILSNVIVTTFINK